jgi:predicted DNA-binding transcriptional regulator YafY
MTPGRRKCPNDDRRGKTFVRLLQMADMLTRQPMSHAELSAEFQVCTRTVIRDLKVIARSGAFVDISRINDYKARVSRLKAVR